MRELLALVLSWSHEASQPQEVFPLVTTAIDALKRATGRIPIKQVRTLRECLQIRGDVY
jgi:hypothetical protein